VLQSQKEMSEVNGHLSEKKSQSSCEIAAQGNAIIKDHELASSGTSER